MRTKLTKQNWYNSFIANCPQSVPVKELLKSVNTWEYRQKYGGTFLRSTVTSQTA